MLFLYINYINIEKISFLWEIYKYINDFKNRKEINEPYFISKVDDYLNSLDDKFVLNLPKIKKID